MGLLGFYAGVLRLHALRRKSVLLLLLIALALVVLCLQYNTTIRSDGELHKSEFTQDQNRKFKDFKIENLFLRDREKNVQFVMAGAVTSSEQWPNQAQSDINRSSKSQFLNKFPEQPTRDEISRRRSSLDFYTAGKSLSEVSTISGLAYKFGPDDDLTTLRREEFEQKLFQSFRRLPSLSFYKKSMDLDTLNLPDLPDLMQLSNMPRSGKIKEDMKSEQYDSLYSMGIPVVHLDSYIPEKRLVHFDLKGAPPKISYIKKVITLAKQMGATGLLMEYEDMFPFWGPLSSIAAENAYSKADIEDIVLFAKANELDVIPLVQTFGHVEFALKLKNFADLREVAESPQALCPLNNASIDFVETLIDQVMNLHPSVKYIHIGCDEVFQMGECPKCRVQARHDLFLSHVARVAGYVRKKYSNVTPIIWDDMLRHLPSESLEVYNLGKLVEPMVWVYAEDIYRFVTLPIWEKYAEIFPRVWAASAFKGAFGETMYVPNIKRHLENNLRWLEVMTNESPKFKNGFAGITITGWQRYDHFAVLCELLPAGIPSLAVNVLATSHGYFNQSLRAKLYNGLNCQSDSQANSNIVNLNSDPFLWNKLSRCFFPGSSFFKLLYRLHSAEKEVKEFLDTTTRSKGWLTDYNIRHNFSSPLRVDELMMEFFRVHSTLTSLSNHIRESLEDIFDEYTVNEWIEQRISPDLRRLDKLEADAANLKAVKYWPRRPLKSPKETHPSGVPPIL